MAPPVTAAPGAAEDLAGAYRRLNAAYEQSLRYAEDVRRLYRHLRRAVCQSLLGLANALEAKDPYTRGHAERVGAWSRHVAAALGLPPGDVETIGQAGLLHDLGKIGVPEAVLRKPGRLEEAEWALMRAHPVIGARIVAPFDFFAGAALVIRHHHERWDGTGYPDGLAGEAIPLGARIVAVADVYDALTSDRPYRRAMSHAAALAHLRGTAGGTLDVRAVAAFAGLVRGQDGRRGSAVDVGARASGAAGAIAPR
jgi:HD-GYP domain-containing protein (c-di-GMP phosphodiesterase class II)